MEKITLDKDKKLLTVTADSFPDGIAEAHTKLQSLVRFAADRTYFGLSRSEKGGDIVYKAAAEEKADGEAKQLNCDSLILKKGNYICLNVQDYRKDILGIDHAFKKLLTYPGLDPQGYCVEWYSADNETVKCMIRLEK